MVIPEGFELVVTDSSVYASGGRDAELPGRFIDTASGLYVDLFEFFPTTLTIVSPGAGTNITIDLLAPRASVCWGGCRRCTVPGLFTVPTEWIYPLSPCVFEGKILMCPLNTDKYLTLLYDNDYMESWAPWWQGMV
ncbi:hypothetical protein ACHHYP_20293 [Achlya hypogyna]|uniref:Uncharacterized protein n=1 Tax=Achlya hypogyna TaxID=1202772 RepID=A0A1V9YSS9_ACHHY|nr:hypothetical protein ACHHYP_20293 [Achlya hypogyna]